MGNKSNHNHSFECDEFDFLKHLEIVDDITIHINVKDFGAKGMYSPKLHLTVIGVHAYDNTMCQQQ